MRKMVAVAGLLAVLSQAAWAAGTAKESSYWSDAGYGSLAVLTNVLYMPTKVVYATLGTITGGLAYLLTVGDTETAERIWSPSLGGSYVVTPAMLRGDEPILFNGESYSGSND